MAQNPIFGFFAYPSKPELLGETIRNGAAKINAAKVVQIKTWETCRVGGKIVINEICREIDRAAFFCADLTGLNHNVMFELGYAIARNKRIWIVLDCSDVATMADFQKLRILTTVGYSSYCNSDDIRASFLREHPWTDLEATVFDQCIKANLQGAVDQNVFYLKSRHMSEASTVVSREVAKATEEMHCAQIVDDPRETAVQPLSWYAEQVYKARCVVAHLINPTREGASLHNTKYAFVAGLAHGLEKPVLMLAQGDFAIPLDYRELLKQYHTASEAERYLHSWFLPLLESVKGTIAERGSYLAHVQLAQQLVELKVGEPLAENEEERLVRDYFVETTTYLEALEGRQTIFVGRKGSGKTANFLKLAATLSADRRNLVCVIKPVSYEMHGIVELLQRYRTMNLKGYVIESIWKFLIYSEIALTVEEAINSRPSSQVYGHEKDLIAVLDRNDEMLRQAFAVRLERCIKALLEASQNVDSTKIEEHRVAVSETLHSGILRTLREVIVKALPEKQRVAIAIDNLDNAWDKQSDLTNLSEFLLGLLGASNRVANDFRAVGPDRRSLNMSLAVFIRSDIFFRLMELAQEPDKIAHSKLNWNDNEMLLRVIDERFASSSQTDPAEVWHKYFCASVRGTPVKEYFLGRILKRPRDLLIFVKNSITVAVNRRHSFVDENDIMEAEKQYSQFAVDSILVENGITVRQLESVIFEFAGKGPIVTQEEIGALLKQAGVEREKHEDVTRHLCRLTFLGEEVRNDDFRFADDEVEEHRNAALARQLRVSAGGVARYRINPAFWAFLEVPL